MPCSTLEKMSAIATSETARTGPTAATMRAAVTRRRNPRRRRGAMAENDAPGPPRRRLRSKIPDRRYMLAAFTLPLERPESGSPAGVWISPDVLLSDSDDADLLTARAPRRG